MDLCFVLFCFCWGVVCIVLLCVCVSFVAVCGAARCFWFSLGSACGAAAHSAAHNYTKLRTTTNHKQLQATHLRQGRRRRRLGAELCKDLLRAGAELAAQHAVDDAEGARLGLVLFLCIGRGGVIVWYGVVVWIGFVCFRVVLGAGFSVRRCGADGLEEDAPVPPTVHIKHSPNDTVQTTRPPSHLQQRQVLAVLGGHRREGGGKLPRLDVHAAVEAADLGVALFCLGSS